MKFTTLIDNCVYKNKLISEHGLSYFVETDGLNILFDTGQSGNFIKNAKILGIDLTNVDYVVLSHGHYDHGGGLKDFFEINKKAKLICKKEAFFDKYSNSKGFLHKVGLGINLDEIISRVIIFDEEFELTSNIIFASTYNQNVKIKNGFFIKQGEEYIDDNFKDEIMMIVKNKKIMINGCSHNGVFQSIKKAKSYCDIDIFVGGMHISNAPKKDIIFMAERLKDIGLKRIITSHCTGALSFSYLSRILDNDIVLTSVGDVFEID